MAFLAFSGLASLYYPNRCVLIRSTGSNGFENEVVLSKIRAWEVVGHSLGNIGVQKSE